jgi:hypothetical protein
MWSASASPGHILVNDRLLVKLARDEHTFSRPAAGWTATSAEGLDPVNGHSL